MIKKLITIIIVLFFANNIFANKTDSLKTNKWSIIISSNFSQFYKYYFTDRLNCDKKTGLFPGGAIGLQKRIVNNNGFKYNIGLSVANFNIKQVFIYPDDYFIEMGAIGSPPNKYSVKTEVMKDSYYDLLITPVNMQFGILENHLYINYSLNLSLNIYYIENIFFKDKNNNVVLKFHNSYISPLYLFDNKIGWDTFFSTAFDYLQNDIGFLFYPRYLRKYNIGVSLNFGFYFNPFIVYYSKELKYGFDRYKTFHIDFIWKL